MSTKKMFIAVLTVFIILEVTGYVIHGLLLSKTYEGLAAVFRPVAEMNALMWRMWLADVVWSFFFVFIFNKGFQNKGLIEGVRYGIYISLFMNFVAAVAQNAVYPVPYTLALQWFIYGTIQNVILGVVVAYFAKPTAKAAEA